MNVTVVTHGALVNSDHVTYRRAVDSDVAPTPFDEYVTWAKTPDGDDSHVVVLTNDGFAYPDPTSAATSLGSVGYVDRYGPSDQGGLIDLDLGPVRPGSPVTFTLYFGVALDADEARASVEGVVPTSTCSGSPAPSCPPTRRCSRSAPATWATGRSRRARCPAGYAPSRRRRAGSRSRYGTRAAVRRRSVTVRHRLVALLGAAALVATLTGCIDHPPDAAELTNESDQPVVVTFEGPTRSSSCPPGGPEPARRRVRGDRHRRVRAGRQVLASFDEGACTTTIRRRTTTARSPCTTAGRRRSADPRRVTDRGASFGSCRAATTTRSPAGCD